MGSKGVLAKSTVLAAGVSLAILVPTVAGAADIGATLAAGAGIERMTGGSASDVLQQTGSGTRVKVTATRSGTGRTGTRTLQSGAPEDSSESDMDAEPASRDDRSVGQQTASTSHRRTPTLGYETTSPDYEATADESGEPAWSGEETAADEPVYTTGTRSRDRTRVRGTDGLDRVYVQRRRDHIESARWRRYQEWRWSRNWWDND